MSLHYVVTIEREENVDEVLPSEDKEVVVNPWQWFKTLGYDGPDSHVYRVTLDVMDVPLPTAVPLLVGFEDGRYFPFPKGWLRPDGSLPIVYGLSSYVFIGLDRAAEYARQVAREYACRAPPEPWRYPS